MSWHYPDVVRKPKVEFSFGYLETPALRFRMSAFWPRRACTARNPIDMLTTRSTRASIATGILTEGTALTLHVSGADFCIATLTERFVPIPDPQ